jgi:two-component system, chemotaxis family, protein-glutamate methylesterase/glutaminase
MKSVPARRRFELVVIGGSAGSLDALLGILPRLPRDFPWPLTIVVHLHPRQDGGVVELMDRRCPLRVKEAEDKEALAPGHVYFAPAGYHLLIEQDRTFSLSAEEAVKFSRPSIDVLFESAAEACRSGLIGVILSGASDDGAQGLLRVKEFGGLAIVQNPAAADHSAMPRAALEAADADHVLAVREIAELLLNLSQGLAGHPGSRKANAKEGASQ